MALMLGMFHYISDLRVVHVRCEYHARRKSAPRVRQYDPGERLRARLVASRLQGSVKAAEPQIPLHG
jgi:hypothetical protein